MIIMKDCEVVEAFVAHLAANGYPGFALISGRKEKIVGLQT